MLLRKESRFLLLCHQSHGEVAVSPPAPEDNCDPRQGATRTTQLKESTLGVKHQDSSRAMVETDASSKSVDDTQSIPMAGVPPCTPEASY